MCFIYCCTHHKNTDEKNSPKRTAMRSILISPQREELILISIISIFIMAKMHEMLNGLECPCEIKKIKQWQFHRSKVGAVLYCIYIQIIVVFIKHSDHYKCRVMNWHRLVLLGYFRQSSLGFFSACRKGPRIGTIFGNTRIIYNYNLIVFIGEFANCISVLWRLNFIIQS